MSERLCSHFTVVAYGVRVYSKTADPAAIGRALLFISKLRNWNRNFLEIHSNASTFLIYFSTKANGHREDLKKACNEVREMLALGDVQFPTLAFLFNADEELGLI